MGGPNRRITTCTSRKHKVEACCTRYELIAQRRTVMDAEGSTTSEIFAIPGVAYTAGRAQPCVIAPNGARKAIYRFRGTTPDRGWGDHRSFPQKYAVPKGGWRLSGDHLDVLCAHNVTHRPALMRVANNHMAQLS